MAQNITDMSTSMPCSLALFRFQLCFIAIPPFIGHFLRGRANDEFGSIFIHVISPDTGVVVQLLDRSDKVVAKERADKDGNADFFYMKPGEYFMRCFVDANGSLSLPSPLHLLPPLLTFFLPSKAGSLLEKMIK